jgi:predicted oxidoreductase (fatty acid repression mutant protein)
MKCNKCTCFIYDLIESRIIYKKKETIEIIHDIINICDEILKSFEGFLPMFNGQSEDLILMMIEDDDDFINIVDNDAIVLTRYKVEINIFS